MDQNDKHVEHVENQSSTEPLDENGATLPPGYWYSYRFIGSLIAIMLLANNLFIGYAMPANIIGIIDSDLGPDPNIYLATLVNTLVKGVGLLLVGSISDVLGRRWFMIGGQALGFVGGCMAAKASNINTIIGANIFMGMGGSTQVLYPLLIQEIVPNRYRGFAQGAIMMSIFPTLGLGPAFVRMMVEYTALRWRWVYWLYASSTGISAILFIFCYHPPNFKQLSQGVSKWDKVKQIDYIGFILYAGGLICLLLGLTWGGRQYEWSSAHVIATLVIGILVLVLFGLYEAYAGLKSPLFPMQLFKIRNYTIAVVVGSVGQMAFYSLNVLWPQHISHLYTTDNIKIGWMSCTTGAALVTGEAIAGPFCKKGLRIKLQMVISVILLTTFCGVMSLGNQSHEKLAVGMTIIVGLFVGWIELITIVIAGLVIPPENIGSGQAFFASARSVSGTIVTSIYVAIQTNKFSSVLPSQVTNAAEETGFSSERLSELIAAAKSGSSLDKIEGITDAVVTAVQEAVKTAYASSYHTTYLSSLAWGGLALVCCFFASNDMENYFTDFINKTVDATHANNGTDVETAKTMTQDEKDQD